MQEKENGQIEQNPLWEANERIRIDVSLASRIGRGSHNAASIPVTVHRK